MPRVGTGHVAIAGGNEPHTHGKMLFQGGERCADMHDGARSEGLFGLGGFARVGVERQGFARIGICRAGVGAEVEFLRYERCHRSVIEKRIPTNGPF